MTVNHSCRWIPLLLYGLLLSTSAPAADKTEFDDYVVHHSAVPSTFISEAMAEKYNLVRSRSVGLLNVSIHARDGSGLPNAVTARLAGSMINDAQQRRSLAFRRIQEGEAIYYLAQFQYREGRTLTFELQSTPHDSNQSLPVRFSRELYHD